MDRRGITVFSMMLVLQLTRVTSDTCSERWNCACAGETPFLFRRLLKRGGNARYVIYQNAQRSQQDTQNLLSKILSERFRGNSQHSTTLKACADSGDRQCISRYLNEQCSLHALPAASNTQLGNSQEEIIRELRNLLATLAVHVHQARKDETDRIPDRDVSLADHISRIEENGIYLILCGLELVAAQNGTRWNPEVTKEIMRIECRLFNEQTHVDNRNFMIFHTLEKLLGNIAHQFQDGRLKFKRSIES